ncbi:hypothetical protein ACFLSV_00410 [Bacteroidota bacterium]
MNFGRVFNMVRCVKLMVGVFVLNFTSALLAQEINLDNISPNNAYEKSSTLQNYSDTYTISLGVLLESNYLTEGRDNLDNGGILSIESSFEIYGVTLTAWYANRYSENYHELDLSVEYGQIIDMFDFYAGYSRMEYISENESDNEIISGGAYNMLHWLIPGVDFVYSTAANGSFLELSLRSEFYLLKDRLIISPYLSEGIDFGYASEEYDGLNNFQLGLETSYSLKRNVMLLASIEHSFAGEDVQLERLGNISCFCLGVYYEF